MEVLGERSTVGHDDHEAEKINYNSRRGTLITAQSGRRQASNLKTYYVNTVGCLNA